jgi:hypothetical protein
MVMKKEMSVRFTEACATRVCDARRDATRDERWTATTTTRARSFVCPLRRRVRVRACGDDV